MKRSLQKIAVFRGAIVESVKIVLEMHALTVRRVERRHSALSEALRQVLNFVLSNWAWLYNTATSARRPVLMRRCSWSIWRSIDVIAASSLRSSPIS